MEKLYYETPVIDMVIFKNKDIIATSNADGGFGSDGDDFVGEW